MLYCACAGCLSRAHGGSTQGACAVGGMGETIMWYYGGVGWTIVRCYGGVGWIIVRCYGE